MNDVTIYNCHVHLFTLDHVPTGFLGPKARMLLDDARKRGALPALLRRILPDRDSDLFARYARLAEVGLGTSEEAIFDRLAASYPSGTRFVCLPLDMTFMGGGEPAKSVADQHEGLLRLRDRHGDAIVPFIAVDPRRQHPGGLGAYVREHAARGFRGIKIYPPLGVDPQDPRLVAEVYPVCVELGLPILTHCSRGGIRSRELAPAAAQALADPYRFRPVLEQFPTLRVCLAHFGGLADWRQWVAIPKTIGNLHRLDDNWLQRILEMLRSGRYPNLYTDISYTIFDFTTCAGPLKTFLQETAIRERVLFGSDYYMIEPERQAERAIVTLLRADFREGDLFRQIAETNPRRYLGEPTPRP